VSLHGINEGRRGDVEKLEGTIFGADYNNLIARKEGATKCVAAFESPETSPCTDVPDLKKAI